jgi:hypothetical protein
MIKRICLFGILAIVSTILGTMAADRDVPVERINGRLIPEAVKPGDEVEAAFTLTAQRRYCPGVIEREIIGTDHIIHRLENIPATYAAPDGDRRNFTRGIMIPKSLPYGPATYKSCVVAACPWNPFHYLWPVKQCEPLVKFIVYNGEE